MLALRHLPPTLTIMIQMVPQNQKRGPLYSERRTSYERGTRGTLAMGFVPDLQLDLFLHTAFHQTLSLKGGHHAKTPK